MRKSLCIALILILLVSFAGCTDAGKDIRFYYPREEILYDQADGFIAWEKRDVPGREADLRYLLTLYLEGPVTQDLRSPFPMGTVIEQLEIQENSLILVLSDRLAQLEGLDYTIACACLAQTCFSLGAFDSVQITSGESTMTLTPDAIALVDNSGASNTK